MTKYIKYENRLFLTINRNTVKYSKNNYTESVADLIVF